MEHHVHGMHHLGVSWMLHLAVRWLEVLGLAQSVKAANGHFITIGDELRSLKTTGGDCERHIGGLKGALSQVMGRVLTLEQNMAQQSQSNASQAATDPLQASCP